MDTPGAQQAWFDLPHAPPCGTHVGLREALPDGQATLLDLDTGGGPTQMFRLLLLRSGQDVKAFVNRCAHFGVPLALRQSQVRFQAHTSISCNVHYARYRWSDGSCESGECAGAPLVPVPLTIATDGNLYIAQIEPQGH